MKQRISQPLAPLDEQPLPDPGLTPLTLRLTEIPGPDTAVQPFCNLSQLLPEDRPGLAHLMLLGLPEQIALGLISAVPLSGNEQEYTAVDTDGLPQILRYRDLRISNTAALTTWLQIKEVEADDQQFMRGGVDGRVFDEHPELFERLARQYQRHLKQQLAIETP